MSESLRDDREYLDAEINSMRRLKPWYENNINGIRLHVSSFLFVPVPPTPVINAMKRQPGNEEFPFHGIKPEMSVKDRLFYVT